MLKRGLGIGLLCIAGHAYCDNITVNTTTDDVKDDNLCSLREAVEYVNQGMPEAGYNGCGGKGANPVISLEQNKTYELKNKIEIKKDASNSNDIRCFNYRSARCQECHD
ncbi:CSLREA domain-containing protein [Acinetobacter baylyi]|nr:CSLREA domain-containing protein [Acinetobacter baylyi]